MSPEEDPPQVSTNSGLSPPEGLAALADAPTVTPVARFTTERLTCFAKLEYANVHGSLKDRPARQVLRRAAERGELTRASTVVESSSGNFAVALASFCRVLGVPFIPVIDSNVNAATEAHLRLLCARIEKIGPGVASPLAARLARVRELCASLADVYWPDQYTNPDAVRAHYAGTGAELSRLPDRLDHVFVGVGSGATIAGVSQRLKEDSPRTRVVAVDVQGSTIFGGPPSDRHIPGIGSSMSLPLLADAVVDDVVVVSEVDTVRGCRDLLREQGIFAGGSSGSAYAAISRYFDDYRGPHQNVAFLCADRGSAYADTVYDPRWVREVLG
ncbi:pyridoxal-phosphate dependent enzyme [Umezawaea sp. NPDC059074]|uniref:pyridoxal-phosphate dependent enzyme n=1 Tax=Umezawaea sp. NPDC059074 TaxID=3346716 RepID=UPI00369C81FE